MICRSRYGFDPGRCAAGGLPSKSSSARAQAGGGWNATRQKFNPARGAHAHAAGRRRSSAQTRGTRNGRDPDDLVIKIKELREIHRWGKADLRQVGPHACQRREARRARRRRLSSWSDGMQGCTAARKPCSSSTWNTDARGAAPGGGRTWTTSTGAGR